MKLENDMYEVKHIGKGSKKTGSIYQSPVQTKAFFIIVDDKNVEK